MLLKLVFFSILLSVCSVEAKSKKSNVRKFGYNNCQQRQTPVDYYKNYSLEDFKDKAKKILSKSTYEYIKKGSIGKFTEKQNEKIFSDILVRPNYFQDVSSISMRTSILGKDMALPFGIGPTAVHKIAHPDGEVGSAMAARNQGSIYVMSSFSTTSIEEVSEKAPEAEKWFQMHVYNNRTVNTEFIKRVEMANFTAIVITVDTPLNDGNTDFDLPKSLKMENFVGITENPYQLVSSFISTEDVKWIINSTRLPVFIKGILTREGARMAKDLGCKGVIVSTHGGRRSYSTPSSIESLPEVVDEVGKDILVMFDGGITEGDDIYKAIAYGAKYIFIGRPVYFGLAVDGQRGVEGVLTTLRRELENVMALSGSASLTDIKRDKVVHWKYYQNLLRKDDEL